MRRLQLVRLVFSLLTVGVLGGLMAPVPSGAAPLGSEALPIVTVFEVGQGSTTFTVVRGGSNCTNSTALPTPVGFQCYSLTQIPFPTTVNAANGRWRVGSVASNNQARVFAKDSDPGTDNMYMTGINIRPLINTASPISVNSINPACTFPPIVGATCQRVHMTLQKTFDLNNGNVSGPFFWAMHAGGNINAPDFSENIVLDRMKLTSKGCFATLFCNPDTAADSLSVGTVDTNSFSAPITLGGQGGIGLNSGPAQFGTCNTGGSGKCRQTIKYDYEFTVRGFDTMNLTDSLTGCGGTCNPGFQSEKASFTGGGGLPACGDPNTPPLEGEEPSILFQCAQQLTGDSTNDDNSNLNTGGVPAEVCGTTCIVILLRGTPPGSAALAGPFTFTATGDGVIPTSFGMTLNQQAQAVKTFSNLQPDPPAGDRTFIITDFPPNKKGDFQLDSVNCLTMLGSTCQVLVEGTKNHKTKIGVRVTNLVESDQLVLEMHVH